MHISFDKVQCRNRYSNIHKSFQLMEQTRINSIILVTFKDIIEAPYKELIEVQYLCKVQEVGDLKIYLDNYRLPVGVTVLAASVEIRKLDNKSFIVFDNSNRYTWEHSSIEDLPLYTHWPVKSPAFLKALSSKS